MSAEQSVRSYPSTYDLFKKNSVSDVVENGFIEKYYSRNRLDTGKLEFRVEGTADHMIIPSETYLYMVVELEGKATRAGGDVSMADGAHIGVVNNIMHSMYSSIDVKLSEQSLTKETKHIAYTALYQTMLNNGDDGLDTYMRLAGWCKDTPKHFESLQFNDGMAKRMTFFHGDQKPRMEMIGKIFHPLFFQEKAIPTQVTMTILMNKADEKFFLMHEEGNFKLNIMEAVLMVQKVQTVPGIQRTINQMLDDGHPIPYFLNTPTMNFMTIEEGSSQFTRDNLFLGKLPQRIMLAMVETEAFQGRRDKNPFNFQHFGLTEICLYKDGSPYPRPPIKLDIDNGVCAEAYHHFMTSLNAAYTRWIPGKLTLQEYMHGNTLFSYDTSPDQLGSVHPGSIHGATSNVRLEMKFKAALTKNVTLLIYSEEEYLMEIRKDRTVTVNN